MLMYNRADCMNGFTGKLANALRSRRFYWLIIGFFVFEALWVALSARYPMAFDEDFHFGVIKVYSQHWSPFLAGQPDGANAFGALAADPSYLYHYLMSFPYRFVSLFTESQAAHVIFLRLINIILMTAGVILFRRVLLRAGASRLAVNGATLIFALIPTVPLLAGQINYDNLLVLALAEVCLLALKFTEEARERRANVRTLALLAVLLMLTSLVKYAFLPMAFAVFGYVVVLLWMNFRGRVKALGTQIKKSFGGLSNGWKAGLLLALVVSAGLFVQRYGVNTVKYGDPLPACHTVIGVEACMEYGPWARNYRFAADKPDFEASRLDYTWHWLQALHYRLFFMVDGPPLYTNYPPALFPSATALVIALSGTLALLFYWRRVFAGQPFLVFLLVMSVVYVSVLWSQNYSQYVETGQPVAINGRYLIPLLLPLAAIFGRSLSAALRPWPKAGKWAAAVVLLLFLQGGGVFSFILRSDASWYWPNNAVLKTNQAAQNVLSRVMYIGPKHYY